MPIKKIESQNIKATPKTTKQGLPALTKKPANRAGGRKTSPKTQKGTQAGTLGIEKFEKNPILQPDEANSWESKATFNPAALYEDGKVHLLYRAIGDKDISVLGYASGNNGFQFEYKSVEPAYLPPQWLETDASKIAYRSPSGGGVGGSEDPRATRVGDRIYVTYTDFNGWRAPRVALTSIDVQDFLDGRWNWKSPVLLSPPGEMHKNWAIFPEKINGQYAILHSISPEVLVDYFNDLDFDGSTYIKSYYRAEPRKNCWDTMVRGIGPPPIRTKYGWLVIYHATDKTDPGRYKMGAMILDAENPTKILYRSPVPLLAPDEEYENSGFKAGVVYSCGAVVIDGKLLIYYGGADSVVCVASTDLDEFLEELKRIGSPSMKTKKIAFKR